MPPSLDAPGDDLTEAEPYPFYATLGDAVRAHREFAGLTQKELAERAHISFRAISDLERGLSRSAHPSTTSALADAFGLDGASRERFLATRRRGARVTPRLKAAAPQASEPLIGRVEEQARIARWLDGDGPPLLEITGDAGIGKSRLLERAVSCARQDGWVVLHGVSRQMEGQHPYAPIIQALEGFLAGLTPAERRRQLEGCEWLARLLPELVEMPPVPAAVWDLPLDQERRLMFAAAGRFLGSLAASRRVLLALEDLQWAPPDGLSLLAELVRSAARQGGRLRILATLRDVSGSAYASLAAFTSDLRRDGSLTQMRLGPLDDAAAVALVRAALSASVLSVERECDALARRIVERAGGVPLFLVSFAREVQARYTERGAGALARLEIPGAILELVQQQARGLTQIAMETLELAAVNGRETPLARLVAASEYPERQVVEAIEAACAARLLIERNDEVCEFPHELYREAIVTSLGKARKRMLHRRIALALDADPARSRPVALAYHLSQSADAERALLSLEGAGDYAVSLNAYQSADACYHAALARAAATSDMVAEGRLWSKLGALSMSLGKYAAALDAYERAATHYERAGERDAAGQAVAQIGWAHVRGSTAAAGLPRIETALAPAALANLKPLTRAALWRAHAITLFGLNRYIEQADSARRAIALARAERDMRALAQGLRLEGLALTVLGQLDEALPVLRETLRRAELARDLDSYSAALNDIAAVYRAQGDLLTSRTHSAESIDVATRLGDPTGIAFLTASHGDDLFLVGEWTEARARYETALAVAREIGASWVAAYPLLSLGTLNLAEGREAEGLEMLEEALARARRDDDLQALRGAQLALAQRELVGGAPAAALARLQPLCDPTATDEQEILTLLPFLAWAWMNLGEIEQAEAVINRCMRRALASGSRLTLVDALIAQGWARARQRDWAASQQALEEAIVCAQGMPYPYGEIRARFMYGWARLAAGEIGPARLQFEQALAICMRLGERLYRARIESALSDLRAAPRVGNASSIVRRCQPDGLPRSR